MTVKIITKIVIEIRWGDTPTSPNKGRRLPVPSSNSYNENKKNINGWAVYPASQVLHGSVSGTISDLVHVLSLQYVLFMSKL